VGTWPRVKPVLGLKSVLTHGLLRFVAKKVSTSSNQDLDQNWQYLVLLIQQDCFISHVQV
jgi:hypothetical protein